MTGHPGHPERARQRAAVPRADPALAGRLGVPPVPATFVRRSRLADRLDRGVREHPLVLVDGPAGAGKTLLVCDWVRSSPPSHPPAWLTVEAEDNNPAVFWHDFGQALRRAGALPRAVGTARRAAPAGRPPRHLAAGLGLRQDPVVVVLDEFERITDPEVATALDHLLRHSGGMLRLVLVSRNEPLLPLHRYRAADEIAEIRAADLAFSAEETSALLTRHGLSLPGADVDALTGRTEGWAAGLRLWALAATRSPDSGRYLKEFEAGHSTIADFLLAEVLDTQPAETRDLLLRTSILDRIHPALADALTGGGGAERILDELARANAFVTPLDGPWYRQHPLFAEILRVHLRARHPGLSPGLHLAAARWLQQAGLLDDALRHAVAADRWDLAAAWFVGDLAVGQFLSSTGPGRSAALVDAMPPGVEGPYAELIRAARALAARDCPAGTAHLDRAEAGLAAAEEDTPARLTAAVLRLVAARLTGSAPGAEEAARTADHLRRVVPAAPRNEHQVLPVRLFTDLAAVRLWSGRPGAARSALLAAVAEAPGAEHPERYEPLALLALVELLGGAVGPAERRAGQALAEAGTWEAEGTDRAAIAHLVLAWIALERGDPGTARSHARRVPATEFGPGAVGTGGAGPGADDAVEGDAVEGESVDGGAAGGDVPALRGAPDGDPLRIVLGAVVRARLALRHGDPRRALAALAAAEHPGAAGAPSPWARGLIASIASEALVAAGDGRAAVDVLPAGEARSPELAFATARARLAAGDRGAAARALPRAPAGPPATVTRILLLKAEVGAAGGDDLAAGRLIARALATARPDRLRGPFLEAGRWLAPFLRRRPDLTADHGWLPEPLRRPAAAVPGAAPDAPPVEALSRREREVLERVAQLMSTQEVAADLQLSVNTVKTHLKSINRKLCTSRRTEAVRRARRLHLL
ncbi:LuxR C-terminal-related transcriptional regulator [Kitasatospora sp. NBC_00240]|uniref:LuxR C-terminal-related transcriptional regulator n=1 Tax=Kitasatospora sp. NBC_00240 TaxID=2903567 RepID=UPI00224E2CFA|nr:LuxR C-terminal-related transcriptional regulator [Kitasatospora sp. NBC_00240]MCX5209114.1 LuxR C-terminal-related transcriptional regulator [Kitasatospora sp. NBC_00240]